jgi:opacity protein-like surface antigen
MNNRFVLAFIGLLLGVSATAHAANGQVKAPDRVNRWDLGVGISAAMNDEADDSSFVSAAVSYGVTPYIGLGVEAGWQEADSDSGPDSTIGVVPVMADIIVRMPTVHDKLVPYGVLGLGGAGVYVETDNRDDADDTAFAWKLGLGADWFINQNWILNMEWAFWDADVELPGTGLGSDGLDWWTLGVSLKYVF